MEYFELCLKVIEKEQKKFNLCAKTYPDYQSGLATLFPENYDLPCNRCSFMSCYAPSIILNFKDCIKKFLCEYSNAQHLFCEWKSRYQASVCSLSTGPGLDFFAFMLALIEYDPLPPKFTNIKVLSKYSSWQNTVDFVLEALKEQDSVCGIPCSKLSFDNIKIVKTNYLAKSFSKIQKEDPSSDHLRGAHIVLMMKTLNITTSVDCQQEMNILQMLKELLSSLRSAAIIFCLDTTPSIELFEKAIYFSGQMLYGPIQHTSKTPVIHSEPLENLPPAETESTFFVWCKSARSLNCASPQTSFESAHSEENLMKPKPTISERSGSSKDCRGDDMKEKFSKILPWRELPPGKVSWGKIFWENLSQISKKSLKSLMTLNKEDTEKHWIEETITLYRKECETQDCSSLTNYSGNRILMCEDVEVEDAKIDQTEISLTSKQIFTSEDTNDPNVKKVIIDNGKLLPETEPFKQCADYETLSIIQDDNISDKLNYTSVENSLVEKVNLFSISKDSDNLTEVVVRETKLHPEIHTIDANIGIEKETEFNSYTSSLFLDNLDSFCLSKDAGQETNPSQSTIEATDNIIQETEISSKVHSKISVSKNICLNKDKVVQKTIQETLSQDITETTNNISIANKTNSVTQSVLASASNRRKSVKSKADITVCQESVTCKANALRSYPKPDKKCSEILPWKELPPGKIPWGEIFWQNSSFKMRKSLKCVFSYNRDILDRHWIGDVARLYIQEFGEPDLPTHPSKKLLYREQSSTNKKLEKCPHDFNKTSGVLLSIPQPVLTSTQFNSSKGKLNTNAENALLKIGDPKDIALTDKCNSKSIQNDFVDQVTETLNEEKSALPLKPKENKNDSLNKLKKVRKAWNDLLSEHNEINNNPKSTVCINNRKDKSFETKTTQTDFLEMATAKNNLPLIKTLTESVEQLTTSLKNSADINSLNKHHIHAHQTTNITSHFDHGASQSPTNSRLGITNPTSAPRNTLFEKKCLLSCCFQPYMVQCCSRRCNNQPHGHLCLINCPSQCCNAAGCDLPMLNQFRGSLDQSYVQLTPQNLVIPVQGISDNALLKIMSLFKK